MCIRSCQFSAQAFCLGDTATHDDVSAYIAESPALEAEVDEGMPHLLLGDLRRYLPADDLHGQPHGHELTLLTILGRTEVPEHELTLGAWTLEQLVMPLQALYLGLVEPVAESLPVEGIGLTIDTVVVEGRRQRTLYRLHNEGQPAAERGNMASRTTDGTTSA